MTSVFICFLLNPPRNQEIADGYYTYSFINKFLFAACGWHQVVYLARAMDLPFTYKNIL